MATYRDMVTRHVAGRVVASLRNTPVVYLQGPRQAGKSTLAQAIAAGEGFADSYLTLDSLTLRSAAERDPEGFVAGLPRPSVIDEAQRVPEVVLAIKAAVDAGRRPGQFLLTSSANVLALPAIKRELIGRVAIHTLWPFSQGELSGVRETFVDRLFAPEWRPLPADMEPGAELPDRIAAGGYPEVQGVTARERDDWFDSYCGTVFQHDARELANVERLSEQPMLLTLLAERSGQLLNYADLARTVGIPQSTLKRYMTLMEAMFLVRRLPAWFPAPGKGLAKAPKVFVTDTGLLTHLLNRGPEALATDRSRFGHVLESFVAAEITRQLGWFEDRCRLFHFRTHRGHEVDLVLEGPDGKIVGVEVKASSTVIARDLGGLRELAKVAGDRFVRGVVLYTGDRPLPVGRNLFALPVANLWA